MPTKEQLEQELVETRRRIAELQEKQEFYQRIMANSYDFVAQISLDGVYQYASPSYTTMLGYDPETLQGEQAFKLIHPDDLEQMMAALHHIVSSGQPGRREYRYRHANGSYLWMESTGNPVYDKEGKISGLVINSRDISARKTAEKELANALTLVEAVFEQSPIPMVVVSVPEMILKVINQATLKFFGYSTGTKYVGTSFLEFEKTWQDFDADGNPVPISELPLVKAAQGIPTHNTEMMIKRQDGTIRWELVEGVPIYDKEGQLIAAMIIFPDITERKQVETELRASQETYRLIAENIQDGLTVVEGRNITYVNDRLVEIFGYPKAKLLKMSGLDLAAPEEKERLSKIMDEVRQTGQSLESLEYWALRQDGSRRYVHNHYSAVQEEGQIVRRFIFTTDLTERKQAEAERERLQQDIIEAQQQALKELSTPIIPVMDRIIVMPLIGSIDTLRAKDITRSLLHGISEYRAKVVILDITGVPLVDSGVANHLNKTIQAARLKGARTIVTGVSDAVAETIVDLGIDWSGIETVRDLQTGLLAALGNLGLRLTR